MNLALIIAGGSGHRMGQDIPKQFLLVNEKPIIIYTLENFQKNDRIDEISVVCIDGWHETLWQYAKQYNITKLKYVIQGGATAQESIRNGVNRLYAEYQGDHCVVIHDGIRPLVDETVLNDVIDTYESFGNGVSALPYNEQIFIKKDAQSTNQYIPRETLMRVSTPQAYHLEKLYTSYEKAFKNRIGTTDSSYVNTMLVELGETLYFAKGSDKNIKLTSKEDLDIFTAYISAKNENRIK